MMEQTIGKKICKNDTDFNHLTKIRSGSGATDEDPTWQKKVPDPTTSGSWSKMTKLILLDSLLQEVVATLLHLVLQKPSTAKM
jgi:hypothetical protein